MFGMSWFPRVNNKMSTKTHKFIARQRAPRVQIRYPVPLWARDIQAELPFVIGVISELSGNVGPDFSGLPNRQFFDIDEDNFDSYLSSIAPKLELYVISPFNSQSRIPIQLSFDSLDDFSPESLYTAISKLSVTGSHDLDGLVDYELPNSAIESIINQLLHDVLFQKLESAWRGLLYLVKNTNPDELVIIRVMCLSKLELTKSMLESSEDNIISRMLYDEANNILGGSPFGCLLGDYYFTNSKNDIQTLFALAKIASSVHAPFLGAVSPEIFQIESWCEMLNPYDLDISESEDYRLMHELRCSDASQYLCLTMPRIIGRNSYTNYPLPSPVYGTEENNLFDENIEGGSANMLWINSAYAMAVNFASSFRKSGWFADICGEHGGGKIQGIPEHQVEIENCDNKTVRAEFEMTEMREGFLVNLGLCPLSYRKQQDCLYFNYANSFHKVNENLPVDRLVDQTLAARLQYRLSCSRFAHVLMVYNRDRKGTINDNAVLQELLQDWLNQYVDDKKYTKGALKIRAKKPLTNASVVVRMAKQNESKLRVELSILPRYELAGLSSPLSFTFEVPVFV